MASLCSRDDDAEVHILPAVRVLEGLETPSSSSTQTVSGASSVMVFSTSSFDSLEIWAVPMSFISGRLHNARYIYL